MGKFIRHTSCPKCGSSNNLAIYDDHEYCFGFGCGHYKSYEKEEGEIEPEDTVKKEIINLASDFRSMPERKLSKDTVKKYKIGIPSNPDHKIEACFPRFNSAGMHSANQIRYKDKKFSCEGAISDATLFGQLEFPAGGRSITITEGYYDTASAYQMTGSKWPNVGVMSASTAKKEVVNNFEYLNSFSEIVLNFDNDESGRKAAEECASLFSPGKVRMMFLTEAKDASDYCQAGKEKDYVHEWFRAPHFMPDGLKLGKELWEDIENHKDPHSVPYPWEGLNSKLYGIRTSELVLLTAPTGVGKTSVCKAVEYALLTNEELKKEGHGVGLLHLEEPKYDTAIGLMSIYANKPYHLPDTEKTTQELREAFDAVINTSRLVIWDHFGSNSIEVVLNKIRHMVALGCKYIVVDHLSIIVSDQEGDERKQLDEISTKLKTLTMNLDIAVICVIHVNRQGLIRGSAGPEQVANIVIRLDRDLKSSNDWRRNVTTVSVEKNRFCGRTGPASWLMYDPETNRLTEMSKEQVMEYEEGGSGAGHEGEFGSWGGQP